MSRDKNLFGGKNPHGLYVPMTETEQEVLCRLAEEGVVLIIHGWAKLENPPFAFGDLRVAVGPFTLSFNQPAAPTTLHYLDLELQRANGQRIVRERMLLPPNTQVCNGVVLTLQWDIAIDHMDPDFVRSVKPQALGLTSLRQDKDTKERTEQGNMKLNPIQKKVLHTIDEDAAQVRQKDAEDLAKVSK
jgi:hypothetical protein